MQHFITGLSVLSFTVPKTRDTSNKVLFEARTRVFKAKYQFGGEIRDWKYVRDVACVQPPPSIGRDLTKLRRRRRRRRQRQRQKAMGLVRKTTNLHVHHAFLYICLPSLLDYEVKWPNFNFFFFFFEDGNGKAINFFQLCLNSGVAPLFSSNINFLLLSKWATWDNREMVWKDAESIFQRGFHGRRRCQIVSP